MKNKDVKSCPGVRYRTFEKNFMNILCYRHLKRPLWPLLAPFIEKNILTLAHQLAKKENQATYPKEKAQSSDEAILAKSVKTRC